MAPSEARGRLESMLLAEGFQFDAPDPSLGWSVFKRFAALPVEGVEDGVLWQVGCYDFTSEKLCYLDFVRQFSFDENGEYEHIKQMHLEFTAPPAPALSSLERNRWAFDYRSLDAYFTDVESFPEFRTALKWSPWKVALRHDKV
jgi:hypothetical protein